MKVSVIMPVFNGEAYLREAVESILGQTYGDFEFIIIDDGSTDGSVDIIQRYGNIDPRIRFMGQPHGGIVAALNAGLAAAQGAWVFRMDADDVALPQRLALQTARIRRDPSLVLLGGWYDAIDAGGNFLKSYKIPDRHETLVRRLETSRLFLGHPTAAFRRDLAVKVGFYRERFRQGGEDIDLWLRLVGKGRFGCCQHTILKLRKHDDNISYKKLLSFSLNTTATRICYFRKKLGANDLSELEKESWEKFVKWVKAELDSINFFENKAAWVILRRSWNINARQTKLDRAMELFKEALNQPNIVGILYQHYISNKNIPYQLAVKSLPVF